MSEAIGARIEIALCQRSIRWLSLGTGTGYSSVHRYVRGQVEPPISWIRLAASLLGVSPAWLTFGVAGTLDTECYQRVAEQMERQASELRGMAAELRGA